MARSKQGEAGSGHSNGNGGREFASFREITDFLWQNAERLRGTYRPNEYDKVILPMLVVRRLDCVLDPTKGKVLARYEELTKKRGMKPSDPAVDVALRRVAGVPFYNTSKLDFSKLRADPDHVAANLRGYLRGFSRNARDIVEQFKLDEQIGRLDEANLLFQVIGLFADVSLHPDTVPNHVVGSIFEELIRRFNEKKNEEAGDHYTPREIIRLMVDLLFVEDDDALRRPGVVRSLYDPAAGTGGMLSVAEEYLRELNPEAKLEVFGQEPVRSGWHLGIRAPRDPVRSEVAGTSGSGHLGIRTSGSAPRDPGGEMVIAVNMWDRRTVATNRAMDETFGDLPVPVLKTRVFRAEVLNQAGLALELVYDVAPKAEDADCLRDLAAELWRRAGRTAKARGRGTSARSIAEAVIT